MRSPPPSHPSLVGARVDVAIAVHLTLAVLGACAAWLRSPSGWGPVLAGAAFGVVFWTFFEYVFHRWFLHASGRWRWFYERYHRDHHAKAGMDDPSHRALLLRLTVPVILGDYTWVSALSAARPFWIAAVVGYGLGYCAYELVHWAHHATRAFHALAWWPRAREMTELHERHHFHDLKSNFGFLTTVWDRLLGTYRSPRAIDAARAAARARTA